MDVTDPDGPSAPVRIFVNCNKVINQYRVPEGMHFFLSFISYRREYPVIKFSLNSCLLANSVTREQVLPLPIPVFCFLKDNSGVWSMHILSKVPLNPALLYVRKCVFVYLCSSWYLNPIVWRGSNGVEWLGPLTKPVGGWHGFINQGAVLISLRYWKASPQ